ncbi:MAG TPA: hypothetical protein VK614_06580 [Allosphingosinicella sp.]|nr:hypothetical protein [Allosphingosinicella sp.]
MKAALAIALLGALTPAAAPAAAQALPRVPAAARAAQVDAIVAFLLPAERLSEVMIDGAATAYRTHIDTREDFRELEAAYPGIRDAMAAAAADELRRAVPERIARLQSQVRGDWDARLSDADAAALGAFATHPSIIAQLEATVGFRPGDTATSGVARSHEALERTRVLEQFNRHQAAFARTPAGQRLLPAVAAYQRAVHVRANEAAHAATSQMLAAAHRAANDFVRRRHPGQGLPYPNAPPPG